MSDHGHAKPSSSGSGSASKLQKIVEGVADEVHLHEAAKSWVEGFSDFFAEGKSGKSHHH